MMLVGPSAVMWTLLFLASNYFLNELIMLTFLVLAVKMNDVRERFMGTITLAPNAISRTGAERKNDPG